MNNCDGNCILFEKVYINNIKLIAFFQSDLKCYESQIDLQDMFVVRYRCINKNLFD